MSSCGAAPVPCTALMVVYDTDTIVRNALMNTRPGVKIHNQVIQKKIFKINELILLGSLKKDDYVIRLNKNEGHGKNALEAILLAYLLQMIQKDTM